MSLKPSSIRLFYIRKEYENIIFLKFYPIFCLFSSDNLLEEEHKDIDEIIGLVNDLY